MALSPNSTWTAAFAKHNIAVIITAKLNCHTALGADKFFYFSNVAVGDYQPVIHSVSSVGQEVDILECTQQSGDIEIEFIDDGYLRGIIENYHVYGKAIELKLGAVGVSTSNYLPYFKGTVTDVYWSENIITLAIQGDTWKANLAEQNYYWVYRHPREIIEEMLIGAGIDGGIMDTTFNYDADTTKSQILTKRAGTRGGGGKNVLTTMQNSARYHYMQIEVTGTMAGTVFTITRYDALNGASYSLDVNEGSGTPDATNCYYDNDADTDVTVENIRDAINGNANFTNHVTFDTTGGSFVQISENIGTVSAPNYDQYFSVSTLPANASVDTNRRIDHWFSNIEINGVDQTNSNSDIGIPYNDLFINIADDGGDTYIYLYKDGTFPIDAGSLVAKSKEPVPIYSSSSSKMGGVELSEQNNSGISGKLDINTTYAVYMEGVEIAYAPYITVRCPTLAGGIKPDEAIAELCRPLEAILIEQEDGDLSLKTYSSSASAQCHITKDEIKNPQVISYLESMVNKCIVKQSYGVPPSYSVEDYERVRFDYDEVEKSFTSENTTSQSDHSVDGGTTPLVVTKEIKFNWANGAGILASSIDATDTTNDTFSINSIVTTVGSPAVPIVRYSENNGMSGAHDDGGDRNIDSGDSRYSYFLVGDEIIKLKTSSYTSRNYRIDNTYYSSTSTFYESYNITYTIESRAQYSTTAADHAYGAKVYDITQLVYLAESITRRFSYGLPMIEIEVPLKYAYLQLMDLITIEHDLPLFYGKNGLTSSYKWQIIRKEILPLDDPPRIMLKLALAN